MLPRAPDAEGAASPDRVVDMLQTIQVPTTRPCAHPGTAPAAAAAQPQPSAQLRPQIQLQPAALYIQPTASRVNLHASSLQPYMHPQVPRRFNDLSKALPPSRYDITPLASPSTKASTNPSEGPESVAVYKAAYKGYVEGLAQQRTKPYPAAAPETKPESKPESQPVAKPEVMPVAKLPFMPPKPGQHAVQQRLHSYLEPQVSSQVGY